MKKSFEEKCNELIIYEEETLKKIKEFSNSLNKSLKELGLKSDVRLYYTDPEFSPHKFVYKRPKFLINYCCTIEFIICRLNENINDENLHHITIFSTISFISYFILKKFLKIYKEININFTQAVNTIYESILKFGYENVLNNNAYGTYFEPCKTKIKEIK